MTQRNKIYLGDCLELMPNYVSDKSVDMIFCDLPYGTTQCKWDTIIDLEKMWAEYKRVIKDNGAIVLFAAQPFTSSLVMSNPKMFKYDWVWKKPQGTGHLNAKKQPLRDKEDILVFYKKQCLYSPQWDWGDPYTPLKGGELSKPSDSEIAGKYMNGAEYRNGSDGRRYPKQVLSFKALTTNNVHPTQKPIELIEYMIKTYTKEGDLILDNACGSGTTGAGAKNLNRDFIMIEQSFKYYEIACNRVGQCIDPLL